MQEIFYIICLQQNSFPLNKLITNSYRIFASILFLYTVEMISLKKMSQMNAIFFFYCWRPNEREFSLSFLTFCVQKDLVPCKNELDFGSLNNKRVFQAKRGI